MTVMELRPRFESAQRSRPLCAETGDFVQLLGGNGIDTSKLLPITDLCVSFTGPSKFTLLAVLHTVPSVWVTRTTSIAAHLKVGCDNTVVRMVSSGRFVSRVSFSYRLLDSQELQTIQLNNVEDFCFNNWLQHHPKCFIWLNSFFKIKLFDLNWEIHLIVIHSIWTNFTNKRSNLLELFKITFTFIIFVMVHIT